MSCLCQNDENLQVVLVERKVTNSVRLIHDLSFPAGKSLNDYASEEERKYETVKELLNQLKPGYYMLKCDLQWAYRSVLMWKAHHF